MKPQKIKQRWMVGKKSIDLYELYAVWLANYRTQAKYPGVRPSTITPEMVAEYLADKKAKRGVFEPRETVFSIKLPL